MLCYGAKHREPVVPKDIAMYVTDRSGSVLFLEIQLCLWVLKKKKKKLRGVLVPDV